MKAENQNVSVVTFDENGQAHEQTMTVKMPKLPEWNMAAELNYEPKTTFWDDFSIADLYGPEAIVDTFRRAFTEWRNNVEYLAELALVLNHKGFFYYRENEPEDSPLNAISSLYFKMWEKVDGWAYDNLTGDDMEYYFKVTD